MEKLPAGADSLARAIYKISQSCTERQGHSSERKKKKTEQTHTSNFQMTSAKRVSLL